MHIDNGFDNVITNKSGKILEPSDLGLYYALLNAIPLVLYLPFSIICLKVFSVLNAARLSVVMVISIQSINIVGAVFFSSMDSQNSVRILILAQGLTKTFILINFFFLIISGLR
jgi:hypothetical protein